MLVFGCNEEDTSSPPIYLTFKCQYYAGHCLGEKGQNLKKKTILSPVANGALLELIVLVVCMCPWNNSCRVYKLEIYVGKLLFLDIPSNRFSVGIRQMADRLSKLNTPIIFFERIATYGNLMNKLKLTAEEIPRLFLFDYCYFTEATDDHLDPV